MKMLVVFLLSQVFAMKPGPFSDIKYEDPQTQFHVESILDQKKDGQFASTGTTTVYDNQKKKLWSSKFFVGRKNIQLSPDGKILALIGNFYFGNIIQPDKDEVLVELYNSKKKFKTIKFSDVYKGDIDALIKSKNVMMMGGGWASASDFIKETRIEWLKKSIYIKFIDDKEYNFPF